MRDEKEKDFIKPILGVLTRDTGALDRVLAKLAPHFGAHDIKGDWRPFTHTNYYELEMGPKLFRCFVSFERLVNACGAAVFKSWTKEAEAGHSCDGKRIVNLDPGYIDSCKVVLITGKRGAHRIALADGVFADTLLWYNKGWTALPWTFPDFCDGGYFKVFTEMRTRFKQQLKAL